MTAKRARSLFGAAAAPQIACVVLALFSVAANAASLDTQQQRELAQKMIDSFEEAVAEQRSTPELARTQYQQAIQSGEALAGAGVRSAALEYNLGNAYFRMNDTGRAMLHLRRAAEISPSDARIQANLRYVRERVEPALQPPASNQILHAILFLHHNYSARTRLWIAGIAGVAGWGLLLSRLWKPRTWKTTLGAAGAVVSMTLGISVLWQLHHDSKMPPAVVVGKETLRLGRGEGYDPALSQPLGPGIELRVLEERADWVRVELVDGKTGWLPERAIERV